MTAGISSIPGKTGAHRAPLQWNSGTIPEFFIQHPEVSQPLSSVFAGSPSSSQRRTRPGRLCQRPMWKCILICYMDKEMQDAVHVQTFRLFDQAQDQILGKDFQLADWEDAHF